MGDNSSIEWTDATWNPVRGCSIVSKGCTNCYAMRMAHRSSGAGGAYAGLTKMTRGGPVWTGEIREVPDLLAAPLKWQRPRRIFVNSMSDLFHDGVTDTFVAAVLGVMAQCRQHEFQVLTKRPERMRAFLAGETKPSHASLREWCYYAARDIVGHTWMPRPPWDQVWPLQNVWLGVSVEDQAAADERIPFLVRTPAAVRWISAEPLLGAVDISPWLRRVTASDPSNPLAHERLDWVVAGGESGPGARPMHPHWARSLRDQCAGAGVAFFFKQWGAWLPRTDYYAESSSRDQWCDRAGYGHGVQLFTADGHEWVVGDRVQGGRHDGQPPSGTWVIQRLGKKSSGRELDGRTHDDYPQEGR